MNEFDLINRYFHPKGQLNPVLTGVEMGIGDDCALLRPDANLLQAISVDTLVADVHFPANGDPALIGERALRVNLSDLAACAAKPRWFTLALSLPSFDHGWLEGFSSGLLRAAKEFDIQLVGGDTTKGPLTITIQVHGEVSPQQALLRSGARPSELIYVSGSLGDAAAAVQCFQKRLAPSQADTDYFLQRYYLPTPRVKEAQVLAPLVSAAADISDGLVADLGHICSRSNVGALLDLDKLPLSDSLAQSCDREAALNLAASGGDDYELCMIVPQTVQAQFEDNAKQLGLDVTLVGNTRRDVGVQCLFRGAPYLLDKTGYKHF